MTKKTDKKETDKKLKDMAANRRTEWRFNLPIPAEVKGKLPAGEDFHELTTLQNICSGGAYFSLESGITVGSKLNLVIDLPSDLTEGKKVKLHLGGLTVRMKKTPGKNKKQEIALSFDEDFKFISDDE